MSGPVRRRPRHLLDLSAPPPVRPDAELSLTRVQRWVLSILAVSTVLHLAVGLVAAALFLEAVDDAGSQVGLCLLAAVSGVMGVGAGFLIHQRSPLTPWVLLGALPGLVGLLLVL